jgi:hypothetical protein
LIDEFKTNRMKKITSSLFIIVIVCMFSCQKSFDPGTTVANKIANGWWVTFTQGGSDIYGLGTFFFSIYNTSQNGDSIWIDDLKHSWVFKCRAVADYKALTFSATASPNDRNGDTTTVTITNGIVLPKAGRSRAGNITDSLYMQISFSDDPSGFTYVISGTARTGFIEDDY